MLNYILNFKNSKTQGRFDFSLVQGIVYQKSKKELEFYSIRHDASVYQSSESGYLFTDLRTICQRSTSRVPPYQYISNTAPRVFTASL